MHAIISDMEMRQAGRGKNVTCKQIQLSRSYLQMHATLLQNLPYSLQNITSQPTDCSVLTLHTKTYCIRAMDAITLDVL